MPADLQEELRQEFLAIPMDQWSGKALRIVGEYMQQSGRSDKQPGKVWDHGLASLKGALLALGRQDIFKDVSDWLERTCKPYWDEKRREERAAKTKPGICAPSLDPAAPSVGRPADSSKEASNAHS